MNLDDEFPRGEVDWRAGSMNKDGTMALALAYVDARVVMQRLDDVLGLGGWQCRYTFSPDGKKTICDLGIRVRGSQQIVQPNGTSYEVPSIEWVWRSDGAGDSDIEPEKGSLSDAFKRAAVRFGVGRYLYALPSPWVRCESFEARDGRRRFKRFIDDPWRDVAPSKPPLRLVDRAAEAAPASDPTPEPLPVPDTPSEFLEFEKRILATLATLTTVSAVERLWRMNRETLTEMKTTYSVQWAGIAETFKAKKEEIQHAA